MGWGRALSLDRFGRLERGGGSAGGGDGGQQRNDFDLGGRYTMSLLFIDGFDHYSTTEITYKWPTTNGSPTINATAGRDSTGALILDASGEYVQRTLPANKVTLGVGARVKVSSLASNT